ncbi:ATP-binding protein [Spirosoma agri]|uniref:histidine kinase n=1 Tax=Spirosoma agri TaxID=1987381 RepID=A0A6M0IEI5_9BACT|nr:ATP-binding protein [Spirosoma agri]NEU66195.1 GAF domain-containing protein [Spirosoma agri]
MTPSTFDLTNCEREPIHILGSIQSYGYLLAVLPDTYSIVHASDNIADLIGQSADELLGLPIDQALSNSSLSANALIEFLNVGRRSESWEGLNPQQFAVNGKSWNLIVHQHQGLIVLEWEPVGEHNIARNQQLIAQALTEVQASRTLSDLLQNTAQRVKKIIGFDRVMVYRFEPDWHGHVIAEAKEDHLDSYMGLHFPASDIPRQARELYKINLVRLIADTTSTPSRILSQPDWPNDKPLDLTHSVLRAVSPIHIEYLTNMSVQASMSISLMYRGELWGLVSCHNTVPRFVDYPARQAAKFVSQLLSTALEFRKDEEDQSSLLHFRQNGQYLHEQLLLDENIVKALTKQPVSILDMTKGTGAALLFNGTVYRLGQTPDDDEIRGLADWLKQNDMESILQTDQLPNLYPPAEKFRHVGAGLLSIILSKELNEYIFWFKAERIQQVTWAGNPDKPILVDADGQHRISPRTSFAAWVQNVRNTSEAWAEAEVAAVVKLREDVLQVITKQANEVRLLNQRLQLAYDELDAFSYTVSHDLRTPLSSIRCYSEILLEEYGQDLNPDATALFQKVIDSTERMRALIRHILFYSRMGRTELNTQSIDMKQLLEGIREEIMITAKDRSLTITIGDTPPIVADETMAIQLFTNLLSNAAKYTQLEKEAIIRINGKQSDGEVIYSIEDNGIGFDMNQAGKMFDLFKRLENARTFEGSGVGLAIVKRIVIRHGGKIWFHSELDRGTSFYVSLPSTQTR